jgi:putative oxidoreductase
MRRLARLLLGLAAVNAGVEALREKETRSERVAGYGVSQPDQVARGLAGAQIAAGALLALGRFPRLTALVLAAATIPEAATGHPFWSASSSAEAREQRSLFIRDLGRLGGLLVAASDTGGRESIPHRARRKASDIG